MRRSTEFVRVAGALAGVLLGGIAWAVTRSGNDPKAQAEKFMTAVQNGDFDGAKNLLCKDGKGMFKDLAELKGQLVGSGDIAGFTMGAVTDKTFEGGKRKSVEVRVQLGAGTTRTVELSMTKERGKYLVCGF